MSQIAAKPTLAPPESRPGRKPALVELVAGTSTRGFDSPGLTAYAA